MSGRLTKTLLVHSSRILVRPTRLEQDRKGKLHQQVAERGRIQDARTVEDGGRHGLVAQFELLAQRREFFE
jgi:hypothetical protein